MLARETNNVLLKEYNIIQHLASDVKEAFATHLRNYSDNEIQEIATQRCFHAFMRYYSLYLNSRLLC